MNWIAYSYFAWSGQIILQQYMDLLFFIEVNLVYSFNLSTFVRKPLFQWLRPHKLFSVTNEFFQTTIRFTWSGSCVRLPFTNRVFIRIYPFGGKFQSAVTIAFESRTAGIWNHWEWLGQCTAFQIPAFFPLWEVPRLQFIFFFFFLISFTVFTSNFFIVLSWSCCVLSI